ncbi:MAG: ketoacyl-ACP synthase III [Oligoflexales bacterium]|nr:ketoacyl-ACP synthase III [Oligoflexales bacterium]
MINKKYNCITSIGHYHPDTVIDNHFLSSLDIGSDAEWIESRTGLVERRSVMTRQNIMDLRHKKTSYNELKQNGNITSLPELSRPALNMALERRILGGLKLSEIDMAVCGTSTPDWDLPANACSIAGELGIQAPAFDINSACSAFMVNLHFLSAMMASGKAHKAVVFNPERLTTRVDYSDRANCILFGDAATATIFESLEAAKGLTLVDSVVHSAPQDYASVQCASEGVFSQNGKVVQKFAVTRTVEVTQEILNRNNMSISDVSYFIGHQANLRMLMSSVEKLGLNPAQHWYNVDRFGNQGGTGAPSVLSQNWHKLKHGDVVVISVVGAGLTWAAGLFRYFS